ncbi:aldehyde dehydrogenase family protein [Saccharopolyspora halophila]|uniref:Aldehyde dehydrogenase family protein n=1 Tax=Saccharopolyspora halophila TaxID=405551 RepID=A0ABN3GNL2_9PSEU
MISGYWIAGERITGKDTFEVHNPYDGRLVATVAYATDADVDRAVAAAAAVTREFAALPAHRRATALDHVSARIGERADELAELITAENGKPIFWAKAEIARAAATFRWGAEEARRFSGELQRLDTDPGGTGRMAVTRRVPRGPVLGISPFNFPLNLVAHKVAPALAAGVPIVLKPAPKTPLSALALGEILAETDLPAGSWSVLTTTDDKAPELVADERLPIVSFTGSGPVGWSIRDSVPRKHVTLELGGNAAVIVDADWPDLRWAAERIATFATYQAGQSCISVQRVYAHRDVYDELVRHVLDAVAEQGTGDPADPGTRVGPLIDETAAERVEQWVGEAVAAGAEVLTGGVREGSTCAPTVLAGVPADAKVSSEEVFGPVLVVAPVDSIDEGFERVNDSRYGLQAGVFTKDLQVAFRASAELEVGGVIVGDVPSFRADQMPYGGLKESGTGREGVRAAMEDFTEQRVTVLTGIEV